jgi:glycine betaine/proline transport system permease protein
MSEIIPLGRWVERSAHYLLDHDASTFDSIGKAIESLAALVEHGLQAIPMWALMAFFIGIGLWRVGWRFAIFATLSLLLIFATGFWDQTVITLGLTLSSTLIPAAMLFGLGRVPGILSTVIFAMPPVVRLTSLGIRHVDHEIVEAGQAFGCTSWQLLYKVQFPNALPSIMQGVNQTIMLALSMVIIASMVGAGGLGNDVLASIQRLDIGLGVESGLSVVLLAIILDRITESFGRSPGAANAPRFAAPAQCDEHTTGAAFQTELNG